MWGHFSELIHSVYPRSDMAQGQSSSQTDGLFSILKRAIHSQRALETQNQDSGGTALSAAYNLLVIATLLQ